MSLNTESLLRIDQGAADSVSALAILFDTVSVHAVHALRLRVAASIFAIVCSHLESVFVRLHDIDASAHGLGGHHVSLGVASTVKRDSVSSSDTSAIHIAKVDFVRESSTLYNRLVGVILSSKRHILKVSDLIVGDGHLVVVTDLDLGAILVTIHPERFHKVVFLSNEEVEV